MIGTEIAHACSTNPKDADYVVLASEAIGARYVKAMRIAGLRARTGNPLCIIKGLARIAREAGLIA
jgi:2-keto-3-deoxy-galactonokinase